MDEIDVLISVWQQQITIHFRGHPHNMRYHFLDL